MKIVLYLEWVPPEVGLWLAAALARAAAAAVIVAATVVTAAAAVLGKINTVGTQPP
jgi:hypothetical protein